MHSYLDGGAYGSNAREISGFPIGPRRVAAVGPLLAYTIKVDKQEVTLNGRWFHEFDVDNRVRGDAVFALLNFKL